MLESPWLTSCGVTPSERSQRPRCHYDSVIRHTSSFLVTLNLSCIFTLQSTSVLSCSSMFWLLPEASSTREIHFCLTYFLVLTRNVCKYEKFNYIPRAQQCNTIYESSFRGSRSAQSGTIFDLKHLWDRGSHLPYKDDRNDEFKYAKNFDPSKC